MENNTIYILHRQYFEAIKQLQDEEDIIANLPSIEYESFYEIITELKEYITKEINETINLIEEETDKELIKYYTEELELWKLKLKLCQERINKANKQKETEELAKITPEKNIIFAKTSSGNIYLEKDLKDIAEEYYDSVQDSIEQLKNGYIENNEEKGKSLKGNRKLSKLHEIKQFKVRVGYKNLSNDIVYIMIAKMKKSNNDKKDREELIDRNGKTIKEFEKLEEQIQNPEIKEALIKEHNEIYKRIFNITKEKGRGSNE